MRYQAGTPSISWGGVTTFPMSFTFSLRIIYTRLSSLWTMKVGEHQSTDIKQGRQGMPISGKLMTSWLIPGGIVASVSATLVSSYSRWKHTATMTEWGSHTTWIPKESREKYAMGRTYSICYPRNTHFKRWLRKWALFLIPTLQYIFPLTFMRMLTGTNFSCLETAWENNSDICQVGFDISWWCLLALCLMIAFIIDQDAFASEIFWKKITLVNRSFWECVQI